MAKLAFMLVTMFVMGIDVAATKSKCNVIADVGFILDSSGSVSGSYQIEKNFLKALAAAFDISKDGPRASVITFSLIAETSIKFNDYFDITSFNTAVDAIPLMGRNTRIDRALRLAQTDMFKTENGARVGSPKVLILLTDGSQTRVQGAEDPAVVSKELQLDGVDVIVVGIGSGINQTELTQIAGDPSKVFSAASFDELISQKFIDTLTEKSCKVVDKKDKEKHGDVVVSATSSSVLSDNKKNYGPQLAWSGRSTTNQGFFHSKVDENNPWLQIQLQPVQLSSVTIINRKDCCGERLRNLEVRAGMSSGLGNEVVGKFTGPGRTGGEQIIRFERTVMVKYITFQIIGRGTLQINGIKVSEANAINDVSKLDSRWCLQETNVCFGARDNKFGTVHLKAKGFLTGLMLVHKSGYVTCMHANGNSYWGCTHPDLDLGVYITGKDNKQIFPKYATYPTRAGWFKTAYYLIPGYNNMSPKLVFTDLSTPTYTFEGQELRIWYGEDLTNNAEGDNSGLSCADVYAQFS